MAGPGGRAPTFEPIVPKSGCNPIRDHWKAANDAAASGTIAAPSITPVDEVHADIIERIEADFVKRMKLAPKPQVVSARTLPSPAISLPGDLAHPPTLPPTRSNRKSGRSNILRPVSTVLCILAVAGWASWAYTLETWTSESRLQEQLNHAQAANEQLRLEWKQLVQTAGDLQHLKGQLSSAHQDHTVLTQRRDELDVKIGVQPELSSVRQEAAMAGDDVKAQFSSNHQDIKALTQMLDELNGEIERARAELSSLKQQAATAGDDLGPKPSSDVEEVARQRPTQNGLTERIGRARPGQSSLEQQRTVSEVQAALQKLGFEDVIGDGIVGPNTRKAVEAFQRSKALSPTGRLDRRTRREIMSAAESPPP